MARSMRQRTPLGISLWALVMLVALFNAAGAACAQQTPCADLKPGVKRWKKKCRKSDACTFERSSCRDAVDKCESKNKKRCKQNIDCVWDGPKGHRTRPNSGTCAPVPPGDLCKGRQKKKACRSSACKWTKKSGCSSDASTSATVCGKSFSEYDSDNDGLVSVDELYQSKNSTHYRCLGPYSSYNLAVSVAQSQSKDRLLDKSDFEAQSQSKDRLLDKSDFEALSNVATTWQTQTPCEETTCPWNWYPELGKTYFGRSVFLPKTDIFSISDAAKNVLVDFYDLGKMNNTCVKRVNYAISGFDTESNWYNYQSYQDIANSGSRTVSAEGSYSSKLLGISASANAQYKDSFESSSETSYASNEMDIKNLVNGFQIDSDCRPDPDNLIPSFVQKFERLPLPSLNSTFFESNFPQLSLAWNNWMDRGPSEDVFQTVGLGGIRCGAGPLGSPAYTTCPAPDAPSFGQYFVDKRALNEYLKFLQNQGSHIVTAETFGFSYQYFTSMITKKEMTAECMEAQACAEMDGFGGHLKTCAGKEKCSDTVTGVTSSSGSYHQRGGCVPILSPSEDLIEKAINCSLYDNSRGTIDYNLQPIWELLKSMYEPKCQGFPTCLMVGYNGDIDCSSYCQSNWNGEVGRCAGVGGDQGSLNVGNWPSGSRASATCLRNENQYGNTVPCDSKGTKCTCTFQTDEWKGTSYRACMNLQRVYLLEAAWNSASMSCSDPQYTKQFYSSINDGGSPDPKSPGNWAGGTALGPWKTAPMYGTCFTEGIKTTKYPSDGLCTANPPLQGTAVSKPDQFGLYKFYCYNAMTGCTSSRLGAENPPGCPSDLVPGTYGIGTKYTKPDFNRFGITGLNKITSILEKGCKMAAPSYERDSDPPIEKAVKMEDDGDCVLSSVEQTAVPPLWHKSQISKILPGDSAWNALSCFDELLGGSPADHLVCSRLPTENVTFSAVDLGFCWEEACQPVPFEQKIADNGYGTTPYPVRNYRLNGE